jgi:hypothetical protein
VLIEFVAEGLEHGENMRRRLIDWCCGHVCLCLLAAHKIAFPGSLVTCHGVVLLELVCSWGDCTNCRWLKVMVVIPPLSLTIFG